MKMTTHLGTLVPQPRFSILIPTWNNLELLKICVASIRRNSTFTHQIILHINEGSDGTLEWARDAGLDYTHSAQNVGVCYACNAAAGLARADHLLYLNDDMYVCPEWDANLWAAAEACGDELFYFSSTMIEPRYARNPCTARTQDFGDTAQTFREQDLLDAYKSFYRDDWQGASWPPSVMPRSLWTQVGGFSIEFTPGMYSDPDLSMKLWHAGCRHFRGVGNSLVYHFMSKSTGRVKRNNGRKQFLHKWGMASSTFYRFYLRMGEPYRGPVTEPAPGITLRLQKVRAWAKLRLGI